MSQFGLGQGFGFNPRFGFPVVPPGVLSDVFSPGAQAAGTAGANRLQQAAQLEGQLAIADAQNARAIDRNELNRDELAQQQAQFSDTQMLQREQLEAGKEESELERQSRKDQAQSDRDFTSKMKRADLLVDKTIAELENAREEEFLAISRKAHEANAIAATMDSKIQLARFAQDKKRRELDDGLEGLGIQAEDHRERMIKTAEVVGRVAGTTAEEVSEGVLEKLAGDNILDSLDRTADSVGDWFMGLVFQTPGGELLSDLGDETTFPETEALWGESGVVTQYTDNLIAEGVLEGMTDPAQEALRGVLNGMALVGRASLAGKLGVENDEIVAASKVAIEDALEQFRQAGGDQGILAEAVNGLNDVGLALSGGVGASDSPLLSKASQNTLTGRTGQMLAEGHKVLKLVGREKGYNVTENSDLVALQSLLLELRTLGISQGSDRFDDLAEDLVNNDSISSDTRESLRALIEVNGAVSSGDDDLESLLEQRLAGESDLITGTAEAGLDIQQQGAIERGEQFEAGLQEALSTLGGE